MNCTQHYTARSSWAFRSLNLKREVSFQRWLLPLQVLQYNILSSVTSELVMLSLDLVKTRLSVMSMEMRKNFIQVILTSLIEKSPDPKILRAVVKIVEEWVKNNSPMAANQVMGWSPLMNFVKEWKWNPIRYIWKSETSGQTMKAQPHLSSACEINVRKKMPTLALLLSFPICYSVKAWAEGFSGR